MLHVRLTELHAAHQNLPPAIHTLRVNDFWNFKFLTVEMVKKVEVCHRAKFHKNRLNHGRDMVIFIFWRWRPPPSWIFKISIFQRSERSRGWHFITMPNFVEIALTEAEILRFFKMAAAGQEGGTISECQISSKLFKPRPRHVGWFKGRLSSKLGFDTFYLCAKFDDSSLNRSTDIIGASKLQLGHVTLTTPLLRVICRQYAGTWHSLPVYKIWPL